jgi:hypothetical protein
MAIRDGFVAGTMRRSFIPATQAVAAAALIFLDDREYELG